MNVSMTFEFDSQEAAEEFRRLASNVGSGSALSLLDYGVGGKAVWSFTVSYVELHELQEYVKEIERRKLLE